VNGELMYRDLSGDLAVILRGHGAMRVNWRIVGRICACTDESRPLEADGS
jgi:hypothetical protein